MSQAIALISELVTIDHGKYIVKVSASYQEQILGTGLAAADSIEIAEDNARKRAVEVINLHFVDNPDNISPPSNISVSDTNSSQSIPLSHSPEKIDKNKQSNLSKTTSENLTSKPKQPPTKKLEAKDNALVEPKVVIPQEKKHTTPTSSSESNLSDSKSLVESQPELEDKSTFDDHQLEVSTDELSLNSANDDTNDDTNDQTLKNDIDLDPSSIHPEKQKNEATPENTNQLKDSSEQAQTTLILSDQPENNFDKDNSENILTFPDITNNKQDNGNVLQSESEIDIEEEEMDFAQIIDETTIEIKRLGWTQEQGRQYLLENYGKKSRHLLSDEELIEFLSYLKSQ